MLGLATNGGSAVAADAVTGQQPERPQRLRILLTNDDGYDSAGLAAVGDALRGAGHEVLVVAPLGQRSGSGMKITLGDLPLVEQSPGVWSVDASPADAVSLGLLHVMKDAPPDLVVSGANFGQNLGNNVFISGTVGGAMMAALNGIPAIAVSVGIDLEEMHAEPERFPSTRQAFPGAAAFVVGLIERLLGDRDDGLLPAGHILNVNYPALARAQMAGVRRLPASAHGGFRMIYPSTGDGTVKSWLEPDDMGLADDATDTAAFGAGFVTVSLLKPDWNAGAAAHEALRGRLDNLGLE